MRVSVSETIAEMTMAMARVIANSRKTPAHDILHEEQRDEDGDQGQRERDDGEADLARALERCCAGATPSI